MRTMLLATLALVGVSAVAVPARAEEPLPAPTTQRQPKCPEEARPIPPEFSSWTARTAKIAAAADAAGLAAAVVPVDKAVDVELKPASTVTFEPRPATPGGSVSRGGLFRLTIPHAGVWRVAIGMRGWIEVVVDGKAATSVGHGGGPACSGIGKIVDYDLPAGSHVLMLSASDATTGGVIVVEKR
jgi:hypothetical protein